MAASMRNSLLVALLGLGTLVADASATAFRITDFFLERNGAIIFDDGFDAGGPPPQAPNFLVNGQPGPQAGRYAMSGSMGPEAGSGVTMADAGRVFNNGLLGNTPNEFQGARLLTNTNDADPATGLKIGQDFVVVGTFDAIAPAPGEFFGLRLEDRFANAANNVPGPLRANWNDVLDLRVRNNGGATVIQFRKTDPGAPVPQVSIEIPVALVFPQIQLGFVHVAGSNAIQAGYQFLDANNVEQGVNFLPGSFDIFHGETWTQAGFNAGNTVPAPGMPALLALGLVTLGAAAGSRRTRRAG